MGFGCTAHNFMHYSGSRLYTIEPIEVQQSAYVTEVSDFMDKSFSGG